MPKRILVFSFVFRVMGSGSGSGRDKILREQNTRVFCQTYVQELKPVFRIRIRIRIQSGQWIRIQEGKNGPQEKKKGKKKFHAEGFSLSLDVLYEGLEISN
jgi:hypothetical protein